MLYGAKLILKTLLGKDHVGRNFGIHPDDTFIISYPRSGSTWTRFLVANLAYPNETVSFANLDSLVPATAVSSRRSLKNARRPRIIKTHNYYDHRYQKVVYVVRDPRDVVLSEYRFHLKGRKIEDGYPMDRFVARFVAGEVGNYGSWKENVASWLATRGDSPDFLLLRYEDMVADTVRELTKIATFMKFDASAERVARAAERSSADSMRAMEKKESEAWVVTKGRRKDIPFVGTATSGGWKSKLPGSCVSQIEAAWAPLMRWLGYELVSNVAPASGSENMMAALPVSR
jgi:hypothetical protein